MNYLFLDAIFKLKKEVPEPETFLPHQKSAEKLILIRAQALIYVKITKVYLQTTFADNIFLSNIKDSIALTLHRFKITFLHEQASGKKGNRWRWCRLAECTHVLSDNTVPNQK